MKLQATTRELLILRDYLNNRSFYDYALSHNCEIEFEVDSTEIRDGGLIYITDIPNKYKYNVNC